MMIQANPVTLSAGGSRFRRWVDLDQLLMELHMRIHETQL